MTLRKPLQLESKVLLALSVSMLTQCVPLLFIQAILFPRYFDELFELAGALAIACGLPLFWLFRNGNVLKWLAVLCGAIIGFAIWMYLYTIFSYVLLDFLENNWAGADFEPIKTSGDELVFVGIFFGVGLLVTGIILMIILDCYLYYLSTHPKIKDESE